MKLSGATLKQPGHPLHDQQVDIEIRHGLVHSIEPSNAAQGVASKPIDLSGYWIMPGLIDIHVHLREPGLEHKETLATGTLAAVAGGFSAVACMANTKPVNDSGLICETIVQRAKATAHCRVFPIGAVTRGLRGEELADIGALAKAGAVALSDDGMPVMNAKVMRQALMYAKDFGLPIVSHAEDAHLVGQGCMHEGAVSERLGLVGNPAAAEEIMVAREVALCRLTRAPMHIAHLTTALGLKQILRAKEDGLPITCEVSPHHLTLTDADVGFYSTHCKMAPPLRTQADVDALVEGVAKGWIDCFATDHAPHATDEKQVAFEQAPFGILGLQTAVALTMDLVRQGRVSFERWIDAWTTAPAKIFPKLSAMKLGTLVASGPADCTVYDPNAPWNYSEKDHYSKSVNTPFLGRTWPGEVALTVVAGEVVYDRTKRRPRS